MMMNKALPYDAEVEYLKSTGTQWINLDSSINSDTDSIIVEFMITSIPIGTRGFFGARLGASNKNFSIGLATSNYIYVDVNNSLYSTYRASSVQTGINNRAIVILSKNERTISLNGTIIATNTKFVADSFVTNSAYIFAMNGLVDRAQNTIFYNLVWRRNGHLYMDLIPVRVGQVGYLYDKVSGELFGNNGTESFVLGPDV